jgi:serine/threonine protein phosphatase PrpC
MGYSHQRQNKPNQDAYHLLTEEGKPIILTISDGHGNDRFFRSDVGSKLAVKVAAELLQPIVNNIEKPELSYEAIYELTRQQLPTKLVQEWQNAVKRHYQENPFSPEEQEKLPAKKDIQKMAFRLPPGTEREAIEDSITFQYPYGATLLGVAITSSFIMYLQLGDGDILCLNKDGTIYRPIPQDSRLFANETTSLCLPEAWSDFRIQMQPYNEESPVLIFLATDGYSNSFASEEDLHNDMRLYLNWISEEGLHSVDRELPKILARVTKEGSGDDITVGIMSRLPLKQETVTTDDKLPDIETEQKNSPKATEEESEFDNKNESVD